MSKTDDPTGAPTPANPAAQIRELREATIAAVEALSEGMKSARNAFFGGLPLDILLSPEQRPEAKIKAALDRLRALDKTEVGK